ncbi:unnamed protein product [Polarella glacialis]|uniref:Uncharacterized protein n=1 Tax=Polarella glacialis TaxID=89957 RepID=A0A813FB08_POLGL|nr:unnamed protein product [Polarella glacialis]
MSICVPIRFPPHGLHGYPQLASQPCGATLPRPQLLQPESQQWHDPQLEAQQLHQPQQQWPQSPQQWPQPQQQQWQQPQHWQQPQQQQQRQQQQQQQQQQQRQQQQQQQQQRQQQQRQQQQQPQQQQQQQQQRQPQRHSQLQRTGLGHLQAPDLTRDVMAAVESFALTGEELAKVTERIRGHYDYGHGGAVDFSALGQPGRPLGLGDDEWNSRSPGATSDALRKKWGRQRRALGFYSLD